VSKLIVLAILACVICRLALGRWPWAHRRLIARIHPDRGGSTEQVHEANAARDLLLRTLPSDKR
jgi:DnaJ homolog subfamily C member 19